MADHPEIAKLKYNCLLELCDGIENFFDWKKGRPQYDKIALRDLVGIELYRYILYLGSYCKKITEKASDFMAEYFSRSCSPSELRQKINDLEANTVEYDCIGKAVNSSLNIFFMVDNIFMKTESYTRFLYETYHNYGMIFLVMMEENVEGKAFDALNQHEYFMKLNIKTILKNHDWLCNVETRENINLQKTRDEIADSKPYPAEGQAIVTDVYFDNLWD